MQTLRKKSSPLKYKNDPSRFLGDGMTFKAKLIGILEVNEARGDKMCQDALNDLKTAVRAAGEHKQRITISIAIDGLRLRDEKTGDSMYHHPVHKISFIAQDMSDSRAFGYIFGSPDTGHRFFGIKTDKTASQVVIAMRDLFQVVFELKKKEIEMAKHQIEQHQLKYTGGSNYPEHLLKDEESSDRIKFKASQHNRIPSTSRSVNRHTSSPVLAEAPTTQKNSEAIADLLYLEDELNNIQQGISQMDKITPSDPFGPLNDKGESFMDSFKDKTPEAPTLPKPGNMNHNHRVISQGSGDTDKTGSSFSATSTSSRAHFFPQFSPNVTRPKEENYWFDQETDSLFTDAVTNPPEAPTSPVTFHTPTGDEPILDGAKSPIKADVFTDLDPLGTGKVKPYLDKKDFFQELKNPTKKVLKELMPESPKIESTHYFPVEFESKSLTQSKASFSVDESVIKNHASSTSKINISNESNPNKSDPFEDGDPFEKTDPFLEESFPKSIGFPPLLHGKISLDYKYDKVLPKGDDDFGSTSPSKSRFFSSSIHGPLRVSLPPEKPDTNTTISLSSIASRFRSSPSPTEESRSHRRKHYQALKHSVDDRSDDQSQSPILEEVYMRGSPKAFSASSSDKKYFIGSPPSSRSEKIKHTVSSSLELLDSTPDLPLRSKAALYAIKPPPLPPKKQNQPSFRPPARPPSLEDTSQYDYLRHKVERKSEPQKEIESSPKKKHSISHSDQSMRNNSFASTSGVPLLPPPPQRKSSIDSGSRSTITTPTSGNFPSPENKSVLNITLNQLDKSGLQTLASTLGIPTENVYNMTLQQLTKMLAKQYLGTSSDTEENSVPREMAMRTSTEFKADFESNFGEFKNTKQASPTIDRYAAFKELIVAKEVKKQEDEEELNDKNDVVIEEVSEITTESLCNDEIKRMEEDDKYAALRQLSLCALKSENISEELDVSNEDDSSARADILADSMKQHTDGSFTPINVGDAIVESPSSKSIAAEETIEVTKIQGNIVDESNKTDWREISERNVDKFHEDHSIFGTKEDDLFDSSKDDWATFEKETSILQTAANTLGNSNEQIDVENNSPLSSDGKDENKSKITWSNKVVDLKKNRGLWNDEDESWDDYSPKSYCSDESSHDGHSPVKETVPAYLRRQHPKHIRHMKGPPAWAENIPHWRKRWEDDTEDEYDDMWRKHRLRPSSFDRERKREKSYDSYEKQFNWGRENWDGDRIPRRYEDWRKSGPTGDYKRRCDSDASDKEYTNMDLHYPDKPKKYYLQQKSAEMQWAEQRESRCKFKKPSSHKRPSSASDAKRYDMIYSPVDHSPRSIEKTGLRESEDEDFPSRFHSSRKDPRYHSNNEYYGSYDRRAQTMYHKKMHRGKRGGYSSREVELEEPKTVNRSVDYNKMNVRPPEPPLSANSLKSEDTPEPIKELHFKFEDDFIPSPGGKGISPKNTPSETHQLNRLHENDWTKKRSIEENSISDNNNSRHASFGSEFETSTRGLVLDRGKNDSGITKKPSLKGKNHLAKLGRQDSSTSLRKSESINIFSRDSDPFEDDDFFSIGSASNNGRLNNKFAEKSKSNSNVSDPFAWKEMFSDITHEDGL